MSNTEIFNPVCIEMLEGLAESDQKKGFKVFVGKLEKFWTAAEPGSGFVLSRVGVDAKQGSSYWQVAFAEWLMQVIETEQLSKDQKESTNNVNLLLRTKIHGLKINYNFDAKNQIKIFGLKFAPAE